MGLTPTVLKELKKIMKPVNLEEFNASVMGIDGNQWLHKGARLCSKELLTGQKTSRHIDFVVSRANHLKGHGIEPYFVFDGMRLPIKDRIKDQRTNKRQRNLKKAKDLDREKKFEEAIKAYTEAVHVTPEMIHDVTRVLNQHNIRFIVAPYEADAQLAYLALNGVVDTVITNDPDLVLYGCPQIIFEMGKYSDGFLYEASNFQHCEYFKDCDFEMFTQSCLLSGCDYLHTLIDLQTAIELIGLHKTYQKVLKHLRDKAQEKNPNKASRIPMDYEDNFRRASYMFKYATVFDHDLKTVPLSPIGEELKLTDDVDFLGPMLDDQIAQKIALGDIDPTSKEPFQIIHDEEIT